MSVEEGILTLVLDGLSNIKDLLSDTKDIEECLQESKLNKKAITTKTLKHTKELVDKLCERSNIIKESFYAKYDVFIQQEGKEDCSSSVNVNNADVINLESIRSEEMQDILHGNSTTLNENRNDNCESGSPEIGNNDETLPVDYDLDVAKIQENGPESSNLALASDAVEMPSELESINLEGRDEHLNNASNTSDIINSSLVETKESVNLIEQNKENIDQPKQLPKIKVIDLCKLIDPKPRKSVKFDSSVIILTSSDEEGTFTKKISNDKENGVLKSALKNTSTRSNKTDTTLGEPNKETVKRTRAKSSSDESNSDREKSLKKIKLTIKLDKIQSYLSRDSDEASDHSESEDNSTRKSSRLRRREEEKTKTKEKYKAIFKRKISERERNNREKDSKKRSKKNKDVIQKLSDTNSSDDSDSERNNKIKRQAIKHKQKKETMHTSLDARKDKKFTYLVHIPLPLIECHKLKEIYLRNKEILEIKRLTNLKSLAKKSHKTVSNSSEKQKNKSSKTKSESESDDNQTSDDELHLMSEGTNIEHTVGTTSDKDKEMATIVLSQLQHSDEEKEMDKASSSDCDSNGGNAKKKCTKSKNDKEISQDKVESKDKTDQENENISTKSEENNSKTTESEKEKNESEISDDKNDQIEQTEENFSNNSDQDDVPKTKRKKSKEDSDSKTRKDEDDGQTNDTDSDTSDSEKNKVKKAEKKNSSDKGEVVEEDENTEKTNAEVSGDKNHQAKGKESGTSSESDTEKKKKKTWRKDKLLVEKIDSTDSEDDFSKFCKKDNKSREKIMRKAKKKMKKSVISDSDNSDSEKDKKDDSDEESHSVSEKSSSDSKSGSDEDEDGKKSKKKPARKRIKRVKDSSSSEDDKSTRKQIRRLIDRDSLSETTKQAEAEEKERKARIAEKQKKYNNIFEEKKDATIDKIVLEQDEEKKKELLAIDPKLVKKLKPHQANGIRFMWDACFESLERSKEGKGGGCILAHCMGLGKTLQVIALSHALLTNRGKTGVDKILVVCPVNTVLNWKAEFKKWLPKNNHFEVYEFASCKKNYERQYSVNEWHTDGGVMIIGYTMFRNLTNPENKRLSKKMRSVFAEGLVDPGPDLVICDEGHLLKNEKTNLSMAMNRIKTPRRIVLTGTPLQNNLREYWCMVQFIKPNLLGTFKEYMNRFVNPITNGQYTDSTQHDLMLMRKRSHVLHKLLDGVVQRRDYAVLEPYLPPKHEYVLFLKLSPIQVKLYKHYMERYARQNNGSNRTSFLFTDFQRLQRICTHPRVLGDKTCEKRDKSDDEEEDSEGSLKDFIDDGDTPSSSTSSSGSASGSDDDSDDSKKQKNKDKKSQQKSRITRAIAALRKENNEESDSDIVEIEQIKKEWWQEFCDGEELDNIKNSGKLSLLFQILKECEEIGDKILVFSQSLYTLNCIEYFLEKIDSATQNDETEKIGGYSGSWAIGLDYFRLDGSSSCDNRSIWCDQFNNPNNTRARLFLISTKAGGLGINLVAANRVIIFDVSWNPSHDIQSIYRIYRFGQTKPCYVYRFVTYGAMEMKIYERQVTKQAISKRVIDEQQIDRHYNQNDLQELYKCDLEPEDRPIPLVPKDVLLGEMLQKYEDIIFQYHIHQSLLENKEDEGLNEEERKAAWEEFENEKVLRKTYVNPLNANMGINIGMNMNPQLIATALKNIVKSDNPTWSDAQITGIVPALAQQLQVQMSENDMSMYIRVQQEIQKMQQERMREAYYMQQWKLLQQQQQRQQSFLGNMYIDPRQAKVIAYGQGNPAPNQAGPSALRSNDIIELND